MSQGIDGRRYRATLYAALGRVARATRVSRPIFVIGTGRSGTTLLVQILETHRDVVAYPSEANELWHPHAYPYQRRSIDVPPVLFDPAEFTRRSAASWPPLHEQTIRRTFAGFMGAWGRGKRLLLKSAMVSFMVEPVLRVLPDAQFIHIYRSGPSVVSSLVVKERPKYEGQIGEADLRLRCARYWSACVTELHRVDRALRLTERGQLLECSYERLCAEPRDVVGAISEYAGLDRAEYAFDLSSVRSQNDKVGDYGSDPGWAPSLAVMKDAAALKGYG